MRPVELVRTRGGVLGRDGVVVLWRRIGGAGGDEERESEEESQSIHGARTDTGTGFRQPDVRARADFFRDPPS